MYTDQQVWMLCLAWVFGDQIGDDSFRKLGSVKPVMAVIFQVQIL